MIQYVLIAIIFLCTAMPSFVCAEELKIFTEELPPLNGWDAKDHKPWGFSVDIVETLLSETNIRPSGGKIQVYPWARAYKILQKNDNVMLFSVTRTIGRESLFKWVGPIASRTVWFWKMKDSDDIIVNSFADAKRYTIGGVYEFAMTKYLQGEGFQVDMATSIESNWKKLLIHRIDLGTALEIEAAYYMNKLGRSFDELERLIIVDDSYAFFIALSIGTSDNIVNKLQSALDKIKADGRYEATHQKYLQ